MQVADNGLVFFQNHIAVAGDNSGLAERVSGEFPLIAARASLRVLNVPIVLPEGPIARHPLLVSTMLPMRSG